MLLLSYICWANEDSPTETDVSKFLLDATLIYKRIRDWQKSEEDRESLWKLPHLITIEFYLQFSPLCDECNVFQFSI